MALPPRQTLASTSDASLRAAYLEAARLLRANARPGRRVTRRSADAAGVLWVYGRKGLPCHRCGTPIRHARLGRHLRPTYWCPVCQGGTGGREHTGA